MPYRHTLRQEVGCTGIGLHTGRAVHLRLLPAGPGSGVLFRRTDVNAEIPAALANLAHLDHATTLKGQGASISTVEHLLAALAGLGIDDVLVEVDGPEVPILDGSAAPFVILLHEAGMRPLALPRLYLKVLDTIEVVRGDKLVRLVPADDFSVDYTIGFDHPLLRHQRTHRRIDRSTFEEEIAPARTFGFLREVELLRRHGLALGGSLDNAVVMGESGILNPGLRFPDEFVRHKVLDAIGDLALLGHPVVARLEAVKAGHAMHAALAQALQARPDAWTLVAHGHRPTLGHRPEPDLEPSLA
jgi:UDP-3-O-[3-hydroxymyristoyl] N-acetylglucosamine deacetylase